MTRSKHSANVTQTKVSGFPDVIVREIDRRSIQAQPAGLVLGKMREASTGMSAEKIALPMSAGRSGSVPNPSRWTARPVKRVRHACLRASAKWAT